MKYFTINELCKSSVASKKKIDNTPSNEIKANLERLINEVLDPIREEFGKPITVTSGYRCPKLNKEVGGQPNSFHLRGCAADIIGDTNAKTKEIFEIAKRLGKFSECLFESNSRGSIWLHISYDPSSSKHVCINNYKVK